MEIELCGTGCALPKKRLSNDDLSRMVDTSDAWIRERTGISYRHVVSEDESLAGLCSIASVRALEAAGIEARELDLIIVGTSTPDQHFPSCACTVQGQIGAEKAACFDVSAACSGFLYALHIAKHMMETGVYAKTLIIGGDVLSTHVDWTDRGTCVLFGDSAGAAVLIRKEKKEEDKKGTDCGILGSFIASDGSRKDSLTCNVLGKDRFIQMGGQEVFKFAVRTVPESIEKVLDISGLGKEDVGVYILHQANCRILESVARKLGEPIEKFPQNLDQRGNTSAGSVPILLDELVREGKLKKGDTAVLAGFGAGLTWGALTLKF